MKQSDLPKCPTCGNMPEYAFKPDQFGWIRGGLKCPYDCHRVQLDCPAGNRERAEEKLAPQWCELEKAQKGEKQWREVVDAFCVDDADWHKLTTSNNELISFLSQALCKQVDRIAELEAREVIRPNDVIEAIRAAGIGVKGGGE